MQVGDQVLINPESTYRRQGIGKKGLITKIVTDISWGTLPILVTWFNEDGTKDDSYYYGERDLLLLAPRKIFTLKELEDSDD
jgi:hypothetical protein